MFKTHKEALHHRAVRGIPEPSRDGATARIKKFQELVRFVKDHKIEISEDTKNMIAAMTQQILETGDVSNTQIGQAGALIGGSKRSDLKGADHFSDIGLHIVIPSLRSKISRDVLRGSAASGAFPILLGSNGTRTNSR